MARNRKTNQPQTTARQLSSIIKSARDIMRKDKGLSGELDRLPMLTWIMFLKFLDDMERIREDEALLSGERYRPIIESPYRWRDWAADQAGITGDELIAFFKNICGIQAIKTDFHKAGFFRTHPHLFHPAGGLRDVIGKILPNTLDQFRNRIAGRRVDHHKSHMGIRIQG